MFINYKLKYFIIIMLFVFSCTKISQEKEENDVVVPDQESWNSTTFISSKGMKKAIIFSGHLLKYESSGEVLLGDSVNVDFYNKQGKHISVLISDSGVVNEKTQNLKAIGHVILISDTGYTMHTDELVWFSDSEKVFTEGEIKLFSTEDTLYGTGFTSDVKLENWTITNPHGKTFRKLKDN
ncbi:MAG: LPS export ABC transporter periplasmic protein LptC [Candidatus Marinimicrobia bacterium]|jgi:LPS export ABC transporter protein LptC|nr:LPS export ABC transporter periplasmic protein LptC [Candidatus Neomarinimicrobiota bacterium]